MSRPARITAVAAACLLVTACSPDAPPEPSYVERGYPSAPNQHHAAPAENSLPVGVPIADLPDPDWVVAAAAETGIPERVLAAYAGAALRVAEEQPDCGIGWNTLAGIGSVESVHGSYNGASVSADGDVAPEIIGIPLDGGPDVMEIPDTDGGELDGDDTWDRAVGPMQFIPTTWQQYAQDGNHDGESDPHHIDDAVLTAAVYLCGEDRDLTTDQGWNAAVTSYNQSRSYARQVADYAEQVVT